MVDWIPAVSVWGVAALPGGRLAEGGGLGSASDFVEVVAGGLVPEPGAGCDCVASGSGEASGLAGAMRKKKGSKRSTAKIPRFLRSSEWMICMVSCFLVSRRHAAPR